MLKQAIGFIRIAAVHQTESLLIPICFLLTGINQKDCNKKFFQDCYILYELKISTDIKNNNEFY